MSRTTMTRALAKTAGPEGQSEKTSSLRISQPGDQLELEADRVADEILRMPDPSATTGAAVYPHIQRKCAACEVGDAPCRACSLSVTSAPVSRSRGELQRQPIEEEEELQRQPIDEDEEEIQRQPIEEEEEETQLQRKSGSDANPQAKGALNPVQAVNGGGAPLPDEARRYFEPRFGTEFGDVGIHTGKVAAEATAAVNARAFTLGNSIAFAPGQFDTSGKRGRRLLAHELTHVLQQQGRASSESETHREEIQRVSAGDIGSAILSGLQTVGGVVASGIQAVGSALLSGAKAVGGFAWNVIKSGTAWYANLLTETPIRVWRLLVHYGSAVVGFFNWLWEGLASGLGHYKKGFLGLIGWVKGGALGLFDWTWRALQGGQSWAQRLLNGEEGALFDGIASAFSWLGDGFQGLISWGIDGLKAAVIWSLEGNVGVAKWVGRGLLGGVKWVFRLYAKLLDLIGFGEIMDLVFQIFKFNTRTLTSSEETEARTVFADSLRYWQVRIDEMSLIALIGAFIYSSSNMGVTLFHTINFNRKINPTPGSGDMGWLIHELTHVAQMEHAGMQYIGEAAHAQITKGGKKAYLYVLDQSKPFSAYNREQQAQIVQDYYMRLTSGGNIAAYRKFIAELQAGDL
ncbi:MAG: DUF4157 domain-containing protein [Candidatus Thiodiazotropha sp. (ex Lucinoma borealis)]|nr:DUF4157 domain-containing protein [Candidatus Thiodiazotropha sp. (ex Lucinoma borealis)]